MSELQKSKNWDKYSSVLGECRNGFPFDEGFPNVGPSEMKYFQIITCDGKIHVAQVDLSTQYRAEGKNWITQRGEVIYRGTVVAWREEHDVGVDGAGFMERLSRYTCYSRECNGKTLLRQPYMDDEKWDDEKKKFFQDHPCANPKRC